MRDRNTMGKTEFIMEHIIWIFVCAIWYKNMFFRCVGYLSFTESRLILWGLVLFCSAVGIFLKIGKHRTGFNVAANVLIPYGIYTVIAYVKIRTRLIWTVLIVALVLSIVYAVLLLGRRIKNQRRYWEIVKQRIKRAIISTQNIFAGGMTVIMLTFGINIFFNSTIMQASTGREMTSAIYSKDIDNNMDTLIQLQEDIWSQLSVQERLNVLQTVANMERNYLGIPHELTVGAANLNENTLGHYNDGTHEIVISIDSLLNEPAFESLKILFHEVFHSYQYRMVDVYNSIEAPIQNLRILKKAGSYAEEFRNYIDGSEEFCMYYNQECESDARDYAESAAYDYYCKISEYLEENKKSG